MSNITSLGRVQPLFKGDYNNLIAYNKLDVVLYNGNSYVSKIDSNTGHTPANNPSYWQLVAVKGEQGNQGITGGFGTPTASAESIGYDEDPSVVVTATGPDTEKIFNFDFSIPAGKIGFDSVSATAQGGAAGTQPQVVATLDTTDPDDRELQFAFTIPAANGEGVKKIDGELPNTSGEVSLYAVRYVQQNLTAEQKTQALNNIGAQAAGSYISRPIDPGTNDVLKYNGTTWVAGSGFITNESDPVFNASAAHDITSTDITNWNNKSDFSGDYDDLSNKPTIPTVPTNVSAFTNDAGYLTSYTETDPVFSASAAAGITSSDISDWGGKAETDDLLKMRSVTVATSGWTAGWFQSASGTVYTYYYDVSITGITANDFVDISNMGSASSYTGNFAVESFSGTLRIWVSSQPSAETTWYVYYKVGMTATT